MPKLAVTTDDAPVHLNGPEATAWTLGYDAGVIEAIAACASVAEERGGADGLIIATLIRNLLMNS